MPDRPNVLFVLTDQMRAHAMGCAGNQQVQTPTIDRFASNAVQFERAYSPDPVCSPTRGSLLTGQYPHRHGVVHNHLRLETDGETLAHCLQDEGYATGYVGKWHLDGTGKPGEVPPGERRQGFEYWRGFNRGHRHLDGHPHFDENGDVDWETGYQPALQTDMALDFVADYAGVDPFFCFLSWGPPHTPFEAPPRYSELYDPESLRLRPNVPESADTPQLRRDLAEYYALVSSLDEQLDRLLTGLERHGIADDTIVVFASDHGEMLGSLGRYRKGYPFEESVRVPLLVRYPEQFDARSTDAVVNLLDLPPTLLDLCDARVPDRMQGRSLRPLLDGSTVDGFDETYIEGQIPFDEAWRTLRTERYLIVVDRGLQVTHLYDTDEDPYQMDNLADDPGAEDVRSALFERLAEQFDRYGDGYFSARNFRRVEFPDEDLLEPRGDIFAPYEGKTDGSGDAQ